MNLPEIFHNFRDRNILIAGIGGGYDIYCGLPLYFQLLDSAKSCHLANYSFADLTSGVPGMKGVLDRITRVDGIPYHPEGYLANHLQKEVWQIGKHGVQVVEKAYKHMLKELEIDLLILVDGGVDSLMQGDEHGNGTCLEDSISLAAVKDLPIEKYLVCCGFGTEVEDDLCHYHVLENMAALSKDGTFLGACALTKEMEEFGFLSDACHYVFEEKKCKLSHISPRIIRAARGDFGTKELLSPLMTLYWFYKADPVIAKNKLIPIIKHSNTSRTPSCYFDRLFWITIDPNVRYLIRR